MIGVWCCQHPHVFVSPLLVDFLVLVDLLAVRWVALQLVELLLEDCWTQGVVLHSQLVQVPLALLEGLLVLCGNKQ